MNKSLYLHKRYLTPGGTYLEKQIPSISPTHFFHSKVGSSFVSVFFHGIYILRVFLLLSILPLLHLYDDKCYLLNYIRLQYHCNIGQISFVNHLLPFQHTSTFLSTSLGRLPYYWEHPLQHPIKMLDQCQMHLIMNLINPFRLLKNFLQKSIIMFICQVQNFA